MNLRKSFGFLERFGEPMVPYFGGEEEKMQLLGLSYRMLNHMARCKGIYYKMVWKLCVCDDKNLMLTVLDSPLINSANIQRKYANSNH